MNQSELLRHPPKLRGLWFGLTVLLVVGSGLMFWNARSQAQTAPAATGTAPATNPAAPETVTVYPGITNISSVAINNPQKGWAIYSWGMYPKELSKAVLDSASIVYLRPDWSDLEGEVEGKFNWELIDGHLREAEAQGKKLAFRVMGLNPHSSREYTFPKWIAVGHEDEFYKATINLEGKLKDKWFPKDPNTSPRWKYACKHLADELGKRYNKNPHVAFVEVGTIGDWGEQISNYAPTNQMLNQMAWREHMGWYKAAFPDTPLMSVAAGQHRMDFAWQDENRIGRRTDGFCAPPVKEDTTEGAYQDGRVIAASFGSRLPSFLEFPPGTAPDSAKRNFWWGTFWEGILDLGKPTYLGYNFGGAIGNYMYANYPYRLVESGNRAGYHLVLERASYPVDLLTQGHGTITATFRNDGCRFPDYPIYVACAVLDSEGKVLEQIWCDTINLKDNAAPWVTYDMVNNFSGRFVLPIPKTYPTTTTVNFTPNKNAKHLAFGFFTDKQALTPDIKLGIEGRSDTGWYALDQYALTPQTDAYPALHNLSFQKMVTVSATAEGTTDLLTDGNASTKWVSPAKPGQWVSLDLGGLKTFSSIMLDWDTAFAQSYRLEGSLNGAAWFELSQTNNSRGGVEYINVPHTQARYIRLLGNDEQGLALYDIEVLGSTPAERPIRRRRN